jgi:two-component system alkaline phosphatase synthesis response regulator PhoP
VSGKRPDPWSRLLALPRHGTGVALPRLAAICAPLLGDAPEDRTLVLRVTGSNGKGSVATFAAGILAALGLRTGLHTSPHLLDPGERIRIDGRPAGDQEIAPSIDWFFERRAAYLRDAPDEETGSFEALTAIALHRFRAAGVEAAVHEAVHIIRHDQPDLILLDLNLPGRDGFDITRLVRSDPTLAHIPIIMLTARIEDTDKIIGLEIGADDYVTKPYNPREVIARIRARLRSHDAPHSQTLQVGRLQMDINRREVTLDGQSIDLTPTEFQLLRLLMEHSGYVFTRSELINKGLGHDLEGIDRTLDSLIRNLRSKIETNPRRPDYIQTIYGVGYKLTPPESP